MILGRNHGVTFHLINGIVRVGEHVLMSAISPQEQLEIQLD